MSDAPLPVRRSARARALLRAGGDQRGSVYLEYLILLALLGLGVIAAVQHLSGKLSHLAAREGAAVAALRPIEGGASGPGVTALPGLGESARGDGVQPQPRGDGVQPQPRDGDERGCSGLWDCLKERARDGFDEWLNYEKNLWGAAWEEAKSTWNEAWALGETLLTDPTSLVTDAIDSAKYAIENPKDALGHMLGEAWSEHVWDDKSSALWDERDISGLLGREVWKIGQHATYFIPGAGWFKAGKDGYKIFDNFLSLGRRGDGDDRSDGDGERDSEPNAEADKPNESHSEPPPSEPENKFLPRAGGDPNAPTRDGDEQLNAEGRTAEQEAYFRRRIDEAPDEEAGLQARYDRHVATRQNAGEEPLPPDQWRESYDNLNANRQRGNELENAALDDLGISNNNSSTSRDGQPRTPETPKAPDGTSTRPDAITDRAVVEIKSLADGPDPEGGPRTVYRSEQINAQQAVAEAQGKQHVTLITNGDRTHARPSGPLADEGSSHVLHRNSQTGAWSQWNPSANDGQGGWQDITREEAREIVGHD